MDQISLLQRFPYLLPKNKSCTKYGGFIITNDEEFFVDLNVPNYPNLDNISLEVYNQNVLQNIESYKFNNSKSLYEFLLQLERKLTPILPKCQQDNIGINLDFIRECEILIRNYDVNIQINSQMNEVLIRHDNHYLLIERGGQAYVLKQHSLPDFVKNEVCKEIKTDGSLCVLFKIFIHNLKVLERFYADLDEIDLVCYIIDPSQPSTRDTHRQILLDDNVSLYVQLSPWSYGGIPKLTFIGPNEQVDKFTNTITRNLKNWKNEVNLFRNLLTILDLMYFPSRKSVAESLNQPTNDLVLISDGECCICFSNIDNSKLAMVICENNKCSSYFHASCLYDWLRPMANRITTSEVIQGVCPNCEKIISCPLVEK
ncbi:E3 ubiquitin-protein ligase FANCL-like [Ctenocephalides felis]|uniref:E3 ubiquitin-protein ligase FANCL-like n=1 Tax=Ctenocephalides felis TaxID=7515 RepID=UPI000E6E31BD|nr:E3 ubiquitin-protein ligase FANCL-like [Ctenocephalides felis]